MLAQDFEHLGAAELERHGAARGTTREVAAGMGLAVVVRMPRSNPRRLLSTGIPGLDEVLGGGLREGSLYLVYGPSGSGKTIFAAQVAFARARLGERVRVVTLIAESHGKLLDHLANFEFFDETRIGREVDLLNGYEAVCEGGPKGLLELLGTLATQERPALLVLEGFATLRGLKVGDFEIARFVHELNSMLTTLRCACLIVDPASASASSPEQALVDGILEMGYVTLHGRLSREIQVHKHRAANPVLGRHVFRIADDGLRVFPRLEAAVSRRIRAAEHSAERAEFGIRHLDQMTNGGVVRGATTLLLGAPGAGKTLLGLQFLEAGLRRGERALYFGFYESPARLVAKAAGVGIALEPAIAEGRLLLLWQPALEFVLDEFADMILEAVRSRRPQRLLIDGYEGFLQTAIRSERLPIFLTALTAELRGMGLDVMLTHEVGLLESRHGSPPFMVSALVENILLLRYVEQGARLHRLLSVLKMRESNYDTSMREFSISPSGLHVAESAASAEAILEPTERRRPPA